MGAVYDDVVILRQAEKEGEPSVITVNCPDKTGLGCDLCRVILFFGLTIVRGDMSTDGKWCYIVFWVVPGNGTTGTRWGLLKTRLAEACPSCSSSFGILSCHVDPMPPEHPNVFLLKLSGFDRIALLHDVTEVLFKLELTIKKVKVSTTPAGLVMDLFFITDSRELLHTNSRKEAVYGHLKDVLGDAMISCEIDMVGPEITAYSQASQSLPPAFEDGFNLEMPGEDLGGYFQSRDTSITLDNALSRAHALIQIICQDHKGLLYDILKTLRDYYNIQISYGRFTVKQRRRCEIDLFIMQADGKQIIDTNKQSALCSCLRRGLIYPLRVDVVSRGPDTELLVANLVELSGKGRPRVFYDITLALKKLNICIFSAEFARHVIRDQEWEIYRVLLDESEGLSIPRNKIKERVWKMLMGWK